MSKFKKGGLGRGLDALIPGRQMEDAPGETPPILAPPPGGHGDRVLELDPHTIRPNPKQPRANFNQEALQELADSIARDGVVEPIIHGASMANSNWSAASASPGQHNRLALRASPLSCAMSTTPTLVRTDRKHSAGRPERYRTCARLRSADARIRLDQEQCAEEVGKARHHQHPPPPQFSADVQQAVVDGTIG